VYAWRVPVEGPTGQPSRDKAGRVLRREEEVFGGVSARDYAYDAMGRLTDVWYDRGMSGLPDEHYGYDLDGNRIEDGTGRAFAYAADDRLLGIGSDGYSFDIRGYLEARTVAGESTGYRYSWRGELQEVALPDGGWVQYLHDPEGRRIVKQTRPPGESTYTVQEKYLWNGMTQLLAVLDPDDSPRQRFVYADHRVPYLMQVVDASSGETTDYYLMYDQVGSLRVVADTDGNMVKEIVYDSFGKIITDSNPAFEVPFGFAGGLHDRDTGLVRFGYRDYLPGTGPLDRQRPDRLRRRGRQPVWVCLQ
jgi:uncharacterized protein RhaS with RHS repeats